MPWDWGYLLNRWMYPRMLLKAAETPVSKRRFVRKSEIFPKEKRGEQDAAGDTEGFQLKSEMWVECSYPFPSPGGIKGLFLGAASVEPHTAQSDLKPRANQEGVPPVRTVHAK